MKLDNLIIAHRGIHNSIIPENSILAFKEALKKHYPIELDIQLTKDNVLVIFHDKNLKRMTGYNKNVDKLTYKEIKKLKLLNTNEYIPTLKEILKLVNGKVLLDIEIKDTKKIKDICEILNHELKNYNYPIVIKSFNPKIIRWFYKHNKSITRGLLINKNYKFKLFNRIKLFYYKPNFLAVSKKCINKYKNMHYPILIWTIENKDEMNKYKNITNSYICNNLPFK